MALSIFAYSLVPTFYLLTVFILVRLKILRLGSFDVLTGWLCVLSFLTTAVSGAFVLVDFLL